MTQSELIDRLSEQLDLPKKETHALLDAVREEWTERLQGRDGFSIPGLGTFRTELQAPRTHYSPHHEEYLLLPPKLQVRFTPALSLKERLKSLAEPK